MTIKTFEQLKIERLEKQIDCWADMMTEWCNRSPHRRRQIRRKIQSLNLEISRLVGTGHIKDSIERLKKKQAK